MEDHRACIIHAVDNPVMIYLWTTRNRYYGTYVDSYSDNGTL